MFNKIKKIKHFVASINCKGRSVKFIIPPILFYSFVLKKISPDLEINSTCWDFKHNAKGGK